MHVKNSHMHALLLSKQLLTAVPAVVAAGISTLRGSAPVVIKCHHACACIQQVVDHAAAHLAQANETNLQHTKTYVWVGKPAD
jgi:hypothetical protein